MCDSTRRQCNCVTQLSKLTVTGCMHKEDKLVRNDGCATSDNESACSSIKNPLAHCPPLLVFLYGPSGGSPADGMADSNVDSEREVADARPPATRCAHRDISLRVVRLLLNLCARSPVHLLAP